MENIGTIASDSLRTIIMDIVSALPGIIGAIIVILVGWIIIKIVSIVLTKLLRLAKMDRVSEQINDAKLFGEDSNIKVDVIKVVVGFLKAVLWLTFIIVAADVMGLTVVSTEIANLLRYLPVLLSALIIFMIGMFAANFIKKALASLLESMGVGGSKLISSIIYYIIIIFVLVTSLNQAGIDTTIITSNFTLVIGAFLLAFAIAFGLGSREVVADLLKTFYARKTFSVGDQIKTRKLEGTIEAIEGIFVTIRTSGNGVVVMPIKQLVRQKVSLENPQPSESSGD